MTLDKLHEELQQRIQANFGPPLKRLLGPLDTWLDTIPLEYAPWFAMGLFLLALVWVWSLNRRFIFQGAADQAWWRDLRIWSTLVLSPYMFIYYFFGR